MRLPTRDVIVVWLAGQDDEAASAWPLRESPQPQRSWRPLDKAVFGRADSEPGCLGAGWVSGPGRSAGRRDG
ncbi:hypothetical protein, partial [Paractinoplanes brasiliensis]|uniref:hypothetical protein n=1 Tax=Paractinoplanes brasiliensis TaxID=52695 RepID=UPI001941B7B7